MPPPPPPPPPPLPANRATVVLAVMLSTAVTACTSDATGSAAAGYISGDGVVTTVAVADREPPAGELAGETLDGDPVEMSDFAGRVVVVNVWGSWCPPCRAEAPELVAAAEELADDDVQFLGIDSRDLDRANARAFVRRFQVPYPSIYDQGGQALLAFRGTLAANSIPSTIVLDTQGRVAARVLGEVSRSTLVGLVEDVAKTGEPR